MSKDAPLPAGESTRNSARRRIIAVGVLGAAVLAFAVIRSHLAKSGARGATEDVSAEHGVAQGGGPSALRGGARDVRAASLPIFVTVDVVDALSDELIDGARVVVTTRERRTLTRATVADAFEFSPGSFPIQFDASASGYESRTSSLIEPKSTGERVRLRLEPITRPVSGSVQAESSTDGVEGACVRLFWSPWPIGSDGRQIGNSVTDPRGNFRIEHVPLQGRLVFLVGGIGISDGRAGPLMLKDWESGDKILHVTRERAVQVIAPADVDASNSVEPTLLATYPNGLQRERRFGWDATRRQFLSTLFVGANVSSVELMAVGSLRERLGQARWTPADGGRIVINIIARVARIELVPPDGALTTGPAYAFVHWARSAESGWLGVGSDRMVSVTLAGETSSEFRFTWGDLESAPTTVGGDSRVVFSRAATGVLRLIGLPRDGEVPASLRFSRVFPDATRETSSPNWTPIAPNAATAPIWPGDYEIQLASSDSPRVVHVDPGKETVFDLSPALVGSLLILPGGDGEGPGEGVRVVLACRILRDWRVAAARTTSSDGRLEFRDLEPGQYEVQWEARDGATATSNAVVRSSEPTTVVFPGWARERTSAITFLNSNGAPLGGVEVTVRQLPEGSGPCTRTTTDAMGSIQVKMQDGARVCATCGSTTWVIQNDVSASPLVLVCGEPGSRVRLRGAWEEKVERFYVAEKIADGTRFFASGPRPLVFDEWKVLRPQMSGQYAVIVRFNDGTWAFTRAGVDANTVELAGEVKAHVVRLDGINTIENHTATLSVTRVGDTDVEGLQILRNVCGPTPARAADWRLTFDVDVQVDLHLYRNSFSPASIVDRRLLDCRASTIGISVDHNGRR